MDSDFVITSIYEIVIYAKKLNRKTMSNILFPKHVKSFKSLNQWTHNIGYANLWDKSQHTLSIQTCERSIIEQVVITFIENFRKQSMNIEKVKVSTEVTKILSYEIDLM